MKKQQGFTLVELAIYMGLASILFVIMSQVFVGLTNTRLYVTANSAVDQDSKYIFKRLVYDIAQATSITQPSTPGSSSSTLTLVIGGVTNTYSMNNGNFQVVNGSGTILLNSSETSVASPSFTLVGNTGGKETVQIQMTLSSKAKTQSGNQTRTIQTTIGRR